MNKTILVTGIGGNVAQGALRNIRSLNNKIRIIGTNIDQVSGGNHLCDAVYKVPYGYEPGYVNAVLSICMKEKVKLIIPSTDFEAYYLTASRKKLPAIASSSARVNKICLDKYLTYKEFSKYGIEFAKSYLPDDYNDDFPEIIVKPRKGRGSKGIVVNPLSVSGFDDTYIVQKLYKGTEITTGFYVTKNGKLHGQITLKRELFAGHTNKCSVSFDYDKQMNALLNKIIKHIPIRASCNIQSIVTSDGTIVPFEVNSRISGTNSVRSQFGFPDIQYILDEYLLKKKRLQKPRITKGAALRYLADVIYPDIGISKVKDKSSKHYIY